MHFPFFPAIHILVLGFSGSSPTVLYTIGLFQPLLHLVEMMGAAQHFPTTLCAPWTSNFPRNVPGLFPPNLVHRRPLVFLLVARGWLTVCTISSLIVENPHVRIFSFSSSCPCLRGIFPLIGLWPESLRRGEQRWRRLFCERGQERSREHSVLSPLFLSLL